MNTSEKELDQINAFVFVMRDVMCKYLAQCLSFPDHHSAFLQIHTFKLGPRVRSPDTSAIADDCLPHCTSSHSPSDGPGLWAVSSHSQPSELAIPCHMWSPEASHQNQRWSRDLARGERVKACAHPSSRLLILHSQSYVLGMQLVALENLYKGMALVVIKVCSLGSLIT